nr:TIM barrel protein [Atlantibacter sp.]
MPKFAANISWLFTELPFVERFARAREAGFTGVECLFPYEVPLAELRDAQRQSGLPVVLINAPPGDWARGARGLAAQPDCDEAFIDAILLAREYASALGCRQVHVMSGE